MFLARLQASTPLPRDPVLGITEAFLEDARPAKTNLGVGIYVNEEGRIPELAAIARARATLSESGPFLSYLPIDGLKQFGDKAFELIFGEAEREADKILHIQTPGATGGLYLASALVAEMDPGSTIFVPDPTWDNHRAIFEAAGCRVQTYPYWSRCDGLMLEPMLQHFRDLPRGSFVLLQAGCHNPTGVDPSLAQWREIAQIVRERDLVPLIDCAYIGLGNGLAEDVEPVRILAAAAPCCFVTCSFSKSMSLYGERVGALIGLFPDTGSRLLAAGRLKRIARTRYSSPSSYGARLAEIVLRDRDLARSWEEDLGSMRERLSRLRTRLAEALSHKGHARAAALLESQRGLFTYGWLADDAPQTLRSQHSIYVLASGRICLAAMNDGNFDHVADILTDFAAD